MTAPASVFGQPMMYERQPPTSMVSRIMVASRVHFGGWAADGKVKAGRWSCGRRMPRGAGQWSGQDLFRDLVPHLDDPVSIGRCAFQVQRLLLLEVFEVARALSQKDWKN